MYEQVTSPRRLRVAVEPIGHITQTQFDAYLQVLRSQASLPLSLIASQIASWKPDFALAFPQAPWKTGSFQMVFLEPSEIDYVLHDEFTELQFHRRIHGFIGIVHCPSNPDLDSIYEDFQDSCSRFSDVGYKRCFAFEPLESQSDNPERRALIMFPNSDASKLHFYVQNVLIDMTSFVLREFVSSVLAKEEYPVPVTSFDSALASPKGTKSLFQFEGEGFNSKKLRNGRIAKRCGDIALLSGCIDDAKAFYHTAVEQCKANGDVIWRASALEGLAVCSLTPEENSVDESRTSVVDLKDSTELRQDASLEFTGDIKLSQEVNLKTIKLLERAAELFSRKSQTMVLQIEVNFKLARFVIEDPHSIESQSQAAGYIMKAFSLAETLSAQDQISVAVECAVLSKSIGFHRKFALFIREAALLYCEMYQWSSSHFLGSLAGRTYGAFDHESKWVDLQKKCLEELLFTSFNMGHRKLTCFYIVQLLRLLPTEVSAITQISLLERLRELSPLEPDNSAVDMTGLPQVLCLKPCRKSTLKRIQTQESKITASNPDDVFLFNPSDSKSSITHPVLDSVYVGCGDLIEFECWVLNPLSVHFMIDSLVLECSGCDFEGFPYFDQTSFENSQSFKLSPSRQPIKFLLRGRVLGHGMLTVQGMRINAYGLSWLHKVDKFGLGLLSFEMVSQMVPRFDQTYFFDLKSVLVVSEVPSINVSMDSFDPDIRAGENRRLSLDVTNTGKYLVHRINAEYRDIVLANSSKSQDFYYKSKAVPNDSGRVFFVQPIPKESFPLSPGQCLRLWVEIAAAEWCSGCSLRIQCFGSNPEYLRELEVHIPIRVVPFLTFKRLHILPCFSKSADVRPGLVAPLSSSNSAVALVELENASHEPCWLSLNSEGGVFNNPEVYIEPQCKQRALFTVPQLGFGDNDRYILNLASDINKDHSFETEFVQCRDHLLQKLRFSWRSVDLKRGDLEIPADCVSVKDLVNVLPSYAQFSVYSVASSSSPPSIDESSLKLLFHCGSVTIGSDQKQEDSFIEEEEIGLDVGEFLSLYIECWSPYDQLSLECHLDAGEWEQAVLLEHNKSNPLDNSDQKDGAIKYFWHGCVCLLTPCRVRVSCVAESREGIRVLSRNVLWQDVTPVPQDDPSEPVVSILYSEEFREAMDYFRAVLLADERSQRALDLTKHVIQLNSANYTAWHFRRLCLEALESDLVKELQFTSQMSLESPKNYQLWQHRRWILERLPETFRSRELDHTAEILQEDSKNYHAWAHRQWAIKTFDLFAHELDFAASMIDSDCRNNSAWNQRWFVLQSRGKLDGPDSKEVVDQEIQYSKTIIERDNGNSSPWNYMTGLLAHVGYPESLCTDCLEYAEQVLAASPGCIPALAFIVDIASNKQINIERAVAMCSHLQEVDSIRVKYWKWKQDSLKSK